MDTIGRRYWKMFCRQHICDAMQQARDMTCHPSCLVSILSSAGLRCEAALILTPALSSQVSFSPLYKAYDVLPKKVVKAKFYLSTFLPEHRIPPPLVS